MAQLKESQALACDGPSQAKACRYRAGRGQDSRMNEQTPSSGLKVTTRRQKLMRAGVVLGLVAVIGFSLWRAWNSTEWAASRRVEHIERLLTLWRVEDAAVE